MQSLVSIICLCYNHEFFLREALESVLTQTYRNLEIIIVDDASTDNSADILKGYKKKYPEIKLILHEKNTGNCKAFNEALSIANGEFIIDFATDDVFLPDRIAEQVSAFNKLDASFGVVYTDAELINNVSEHVGYFYKRNRLGQVISFTPSGYVFSFILRHSFLCPPTLMFRRDLLLNLGGYDESLAYEDFDIWVRSAKKYQFFFLDKVLTKRRLHAQSLSKKQYQPGDKQIQSTITVCRKARKLAKTQAEKNALAIRIKSELRQAFFTQNFIEAETLYELLGEVTTPSFAYQFLYWMIEQRLRFGWLRKIYYKIAYR